MSSNLIPAYLTFTDGSFASELGFSPGDLRVGIDDATLIDASGAMTSIDRGLWIYHATGPELSGTSISFVVEQAGLHPFAISLAVPFVAEMREGESGIFIPVFIVDNDDLPVEGLTTVDFATQSFTSVNAGNFNTINGTFTEAGGGKYDYHPSGGEIVAGLGVLFINLYDAPCIVAWYVAESAIITTGPTPLPVPIVYGDPEYVDQIAIMFDRLIDQFQPKDT